MLIVEDNDNMREFLAEQANMSFTIETRATARRLSRSWPAAIST